MRKFLALVLALVMTMSLVTVSAGAATDFADDADITNAEAVEVLNAMGVLTGNNGKFNPNGKLTRGAGAKIIAYLMLGQTAADKLQATYTVFEDVTDSVGLAAYIEWAEANGIVGGYGNGKFGPYDTLTEYAFGKMLLAAQVTMLLRKATPAQAGRRLSIVMLLLPASSMALRHSALASATPLLAWHSAL